MCGYNKLSADQIAQLEKQGCSAVDWNQVEVAADWCACSVRNVRFSGVCRLGSFEKTFELAGGLSRKAGVYNATLHNVTVGDNCLIENVKNYIANYDIADNCFIENVDALLVEGESAFGNGVEVAVLNETGGREVTIHDQLTAHEAYMVAMYRHRPKLVARLKELANEYAAQRTSSRGRIGANSVVVNTGYIKNVMVGECCKIEGAARLKNGSLMSRQESPIHIGSGVIMDDFIIQDGSHVEDGTMLTRCYVGQACTMGHGYSASDCLFFCNCQEENGEACAIFAGPFTVTHHKSTLLIAGMFSFMNAGSGSNQSNHMYKLGPIHQGALERGAKTASDSYILWPARIGAFSLVMGRHSKNPDTSQMPFSYLIEKNGETYLVPGVNLRSVGTIRDAQKWPKRDNRKASVKLDQINYNLLSPYTIDKMVKGMKILKQLEGLSGATSDTYSYQSARITRSAMTKGIDLYSLAINKFLGNSLISRLEKKQAELKDAAKNSSVFLTQKSEVEYLLSHLKPESRVGEGDWLDLSGLIAPHSEVSRVMNDVEAGVITSLQQLNTELVALHNRYYDLEWAWAYQLMIDFYGLDAKNIKKSDLLRIIAAWKKAVVTLDEMLYADARKEFSLTAQTGFGFDGSKSTTAAADFEQVRGDFESNTFVKAVTEHIERKSALGDKWLKILK